MIHNHEVESSSLSLATGQGRYETAKTALSLSGCSSARLEYTSGGRVVAGSNPVIPTNLDTQASIYIDASFFISIPSLFLRFLHADLARILCVDY